MAFGILSRFKKIIYKNLDVRAFVVSRLNPQQITQTVILQSGEWSIDITSRHSMICLDPFCIAIWLQQGQTRPELKTATVLFKNAKSTRSKLEISLIEETNQDNTTVLLYEVKKANCYQLNPLYRFLTLFVFLKNKTTTFRERKFIAALYSYPRKIIVVSYKEDNYCNIFPMDIQGYIPESGLYLLGLRTTNITLHKILEKKKLVISDTANADVKTIYSLGRHLSSDPPSIDNLPFRTSDSELFGFPVPSFSGSYKEVEIIRSRKMGYHMLMIGRVANSKQMSPGPDLYHLHIMEFLHSDYQEFSNLIYSKELVTGNEIS